MTAPTDGEPLRLPLAAAAFASGSGSNFLALHAAEARGAPWRIRLLVSDREDAGALERARRAGIATRVIPVSGRDPEEVGQETLAVLEEHGIQVIFLAGYLRLVPRAVTAASSARCCSEMKGRISRSMCCSRSRRSSAPMSRRVLSLTVTIVPTPHSVVKTSWNATS